MSVNHDQEESKENHDELDDLDWLIKDSNDNSNEPPTSDVETKPKSDSNHAKYSIGSVHQTEDTYEVHSNTSDDESDYDDGLTDDQRRLVQENTSRNDAVEGEDYDVHRRLELANKELESEGSIDQEDRERKVNFKPKLVDLEVPPADSSSSSSSSSSSEDEEESSSVSSKMDNLTLKSSHRLESDDTIEIQGQLFKKDEKVLIERSGKFEFVEAAELEGMVPMSYTDSQNTNSPPPSQTTLPPLNPRPKSAPVKQPKPPRTTTRPVSALDMPNDYTAGKANSRPFSYSPEMKKLIKQRAALKAKKEAEEEKRRKEEEEIARQESEDAWKSWVERKNDQLKKEKKQKDEELRKQERMNRKDPDEAEEAYKDWLKQKRTQTRKERLITQQQQIEYDEGWYLRERRDCNRAFRLWLRNKNETSQRMKEQEQKLRKQSLREMRRARKVQKLMASIREAQQMKYVEYYGYRI